jgi:hypothetical protein
VLPSEHSRLQAAPKVPKMAKVAVLGVYFEHLYTSVNGVEKRDVTMRESLSVIPRCRTAMCCMSLSFSYR